MKEWDLDSYHRKFQDTLTVFNTAQGKQAWWVKGIEIKADKSATFHVDKGDGAGPYVIADEPLYYRFGGRILLAKDGTHCVAIRKPAKTWKIGLCSQNYNVVSYQKSAIKPWELTVFSPLKINIEKALENSGPISEQFFITPKTVYFLDKEVGMRKGSKFVVSRAVAQEIKDSLLGYKCTITV